MYDRILATAQKTPLLRLTRAGGKHQFNLYAKLETFNPGGSIKDRAAFNIIERALDRGEIRAGATIIESSSGNMGIGLAQACAYWGLRLICVVDPKTSAQNINILKAYGSEVDIVTRPDPVTGEFLQARLNRVSELLNMYPNSFWPNQYSNLDNSAAHYITMGEISDELGSKIDYLLCATSTCGTARGCADYIRDRSMHTQLIAVDAEGSVLFNGQSGARLIPGHGSGVVPRLYRSGIAERCIKVSDLDCVVGCRRLVRREAILVGGSSGAVFSALERIKAEITEGANCVMIFADRGERYLDTIYSDEWVRTHFGDVSHLWEEAGASLEVQYACSWAF
jgi:N-(2-amino-2-carboxyethyl)-L-glutamate synthase